MPTMGNNPHTFLHGLSDFWVRFFADYDELNAMYQGVEVSMAQAYLDMLSTFLSISVLECPIFNTEYFKLITLREDQVKLVVGTSAAENRYIAAMPDNVAVANLLQNKVLEPTALLESNQDYEQDNTNYIFKFQEDPSGRAGLTVGETTAGNLLTYGTGLYARLYTVKPDDTPFAAARVGHWVQIANSTSGNNGVFPVTEVLDAQTILIGGTVTLPELNNGALVVTLFETEFVSEPGFANRTIDITVGGTFDDSTFRNTTSMRSWYFDSPRGLGIRKGDTLRVLSSTDPLVKDALPNLPVDFPITVVRHDKLYFGPTKSLLAAVEDVHYVILRELTNAEVPEEFTTYTRQGTVKPAVNLYNALLVRTGAETVLQLPPTSTTLFKPPFTPPPLPPTDQGRYVDLTNCGNITWTASLAADGTLTRTGGTMQTPLAIAVDGATVAITGSSYGQNGSYTLAHVDSETVGHIDGAFIPETVTVQLVGVRNNGTYRIRRVIDAYNAVLDLPASCPDLNNNLIGWQIHDGYEVQLTHTRIVRGSLTVHGVTGSPYNGGYHTVREGAEYVVDYEAGKILQIGRFAGQWGLDPLEMANVSYTWLSEIVPLQMTGALTTSTKLAVREVALWAPDVKVDKYHLYNNYGQYINRFAPSSETYRSFIRGIFQLYVLGPVLRHIESALNVIAGLAVARDDGEYLLSYDAISDPTLKQITTQRIDGTKYTYQFAASVPIRTDISTWVTGDPQLTFEAFEPLTTMFQVTDYVQDPTWWENIVIPQALLPEESIDRRTTVPDLYENIINPLDNAHIGDLGLFIGADDEGLVPPFIATIPAKRRKMANVAMNVFLKQHMFFVSFDPNLNAVVTADFIQDLRELVLIAKPGYCLAYIEPASAFLDTVRVLDPPVQIDITWAETDAIVIGNALYIESGTWPIGRVFHQGTIVTGATLLVANGVTIPAPVTVAPYLANFHITPPVSVGFYGEPRDFVVNRYTGVLTPLTVWPAGTYLIDYRPLVVNPSTSKNPALGDTDFVIGGLNPIAGHGNIEYYKDGAIRNFGNYAIFITNDPIFVAGLHEGVRITTWEPAGILQFGVLSVVNPQRVYIDNALIPTTLSMLWSFASREPFDGRIAHYSDGWHLRTPSGMFNRSHRNQHIEIKDAVMLGGLNNGHWRILDVFSPSEVLLDGLLAPETGIHWRLMGGGGNMGLVEQPLQIRVY